jgi:Protein of unknown function (DUF3089)
MRNGKLPASIGSNAPDAMTKAVRSTHAIVALDHLSRATPQLVSLSATVGLTLALAACGTGGDQAGSVGSTGAPASGGSDYSLAAHWVCRPGAETTCTTGLDATVEYADGHTEPQPFTPAADPPIDCFYVYPTVSKEQTPYADLTNSPEIQTITKAQVGRLSSRCRVFAPIYRQATGYGLNHGLSSITDSDVPMLDVQAAWAYYLQNDNKGRGVVLIGHSQGTILLQYLIAGSIDGTASQALLVSAFLAGDPSLGVPPGGVVGGTFAHIPTCTGAAQTGCVYVWGSFLVGDTSAPPAFGRARTDGLASACVNPAAPAGGSGMLKFYYEGKDPPWVEAVGQISGACQTESGANIFVVTVEPGKFADHNTTILKAAEVVPGWGVHPRDIALVQGNILDVLDAEIATWQAQH